MKKLFWIIPVIIIIFVISGFFWQRSQRYLIGFFEPSELKESPYTQLYLGFPETWKIGIEDAGAQKIKTNFISIPNDPWEANKSLKIQIEKFLSKHPKWLWNDKKILIIAGFTSKHLRIAKDILQNKNRNILCVSPISTSAQATKWPNVLQLVHNDNYGGQAICMFIQRKQYDKAAILFRPNDSYSQAYRDELITFLTKQGLPHACFAFDKNTIKDQTETKVNPYLKDSQKPVLIFTGYSDEAIKCEKILDNKIELICTDSCSNLKDVFPPNRVATVVVPSIIDYTTRCNSLYKRLYAILENKIPDFNYSVSYGVAFLYDFAFQVGQMILHNDNFTWDNLQNRYKTALPAAALVSTWYTPKRNGPDHGGYWFIYSHDPHTENIVEFNKRILGNVYTLPQSAAVAYQIGNFVWAGLLKWNVYQNIWENYFLNGQKVDSKLSYINYVSRNGIFNWNPIHIKSYRTNEGKWFFASDYEDEYPISTQNYNLNTGFKL